MHPEARSSNQPMPEPASRSRSRSPAGNEPALDISSPDWLKPDRSQQEKRRRGGPDSTDDDLGQSGRKYIAEGSPSSSQNRRLRFEDEPDSSQASPEPSPVHSPQPSPAPAQPASSSSAAPGDCPFTFDGSCRPGNPFAEADRRREEEESDTPIGYRIWPN